MEIKMEFTTMAYSLEWIIQDHRGTRQYGVSYHITQNAAVEYVERHWTNVYGADSVYPKQNPQTSKLKLVNIPIDIYKQVIEHDSFRIQYS